MHQLKQMKERLVHCVENQMGDIYNADAKELGEAVDMIKDLAEAMYYCSIVEAMEKSEKENGNGEHAVHHYYEPMTYNVDRGNGKMYYPTDYNRMYYPEYNANTMFYPYMYYGEKGRDGARQTPGESRNYTEQPVHMRDYREGRSGEYRRMYMESKEMHKDKAVKMQELEKYMHELSNDMTEMIHEATPEEKQIMKNKLTTLAGKIV